ncbi:unnamed protein product, partial [Ectocarpus sp. 12 AP-2014]
WQRKALADFGESSTQHTTYIPQRLPGTAFILRRRRKALYRERNIHGGTARPGCWRGGTMVRVRECKHPDCTKEPISGAAGTKQRLYCFTHKPDGLVNKSPQGVCPARLYHVVNVSLGVNSWTQGSGVLRKAAKHAEDGMANVSHRRCGYSGCSG